MNWRAGLLAILLCLGVLWLGRALLRREAAPLSSRVAAERAERAKEMARGEAAPGATRSAGAPEKVPAPTPALEENVMAALYARYPQVPEARLAAYEQEMYAKLRPSLETSPFWTYSTVVVSHGKQIPLQVVAKFYDLNDHPNIGGFREIPPAKDLAWTLIGEWNLEGDFIRANASSLLRTVLQRENRHFFFLVTGTSAAIQKYVTYLTFPIPGESGPGEVLLAGEKEWRSLPGTGWRPLTQDEYLRWRDEYEHRARY